MSGEKIGSGGNNGSWSYSPGDWSSVANGINGFGEGVVPAPCEQSQPNTGEQEPDEIRAKRELVTEMNRLKQRRKAAICAVVASIGAMGAIAGLKISSLFNKHEKDIEGETNYKPTTEATQYQAEQAPSGYSGIFIDDETPMPTPTPPPMLAEMPSVNLGEKYESGRIAEPYDESKDRHEEKGGNPVYVAPNGAHVVEYDQNGNLNTNATKKNVVEMTENSNFYASFWNGVARGDRTVRDICDYSEAMRADDEGIGRQNRGAAADYLDKNVDFNKVTAEVPTEGISRTMFIDARGRTPSGKTNEQATVTTRGIGKVTEGTYVYYTDALSEEAKANWAEMFEVEYDTENGKDEMDFVFREECGQYGLILRGNSDVQEYYGTSSTGEMPTPGPVNPSPVPVNPTPAPTPAPIVTPPPAPVIPAEKDPENVEESFEIMNENGVGEGGQEELPAGEVTAEPEITMTSETVPQTSFSQEDADAQYEADANEIKGNISQDDYLDTISEYLG